MELKVIYLSEKEENHISNQEKSCQENGSNETDIIRSEGVLCKILQ